ncbi:MAG TPA: DUF1249 domain-containing protein [Steroidobacteraceae bacterium]|nr:DUF1249 domain-containing protein [Steroidobacteraceae bacterium]HNS27193.1 DUF1249 domain-containing protein [Steroidobacteraceae bacterium]
MQTDALATVSWRARPRSFVALMALYESNYVRLGWLAGDPGRLCATASSCIEGDCELRLTVCERARYTTTIELTYAPIAMPDLRVRVYHDARLAEAQCGGGMHERWTHNMLLNKWLEYCVDRGHRIGS